MAAKKPSKSKQKRGKIKASKGKTTEKDSSKHIKFDEQGNSVAPAKKNKQKASKKTQKTTEQADAMDNVGGKKDCSSEMIQQAKYYLETWKRRNEPPLDGELPWKFKKIKQEWILNWMYEADVVPKSMFGLVLEYLEGLQGAAKAVSTLTNIFVPVL